MPRKRSYQTNAERQAAYRRRVAIRKKLCTVTLLLDHLAHIRREIRRMRERNKCERERRRWNPDNTVKTELMAILDFVDGALDETAVNDRGHLNVKRARPLVSGKIERWLDARISRCADAIPATANDTLSQTPSDRPLKCQNRAATRTNEK